MNYFRLNTGPFNQRNATVYRRKLFDFPPLEFSISNFSLGFADISVRNENFRDKLRTYSKESSTMASFREPKYSLVEFFERSTEGSKCGYCGAKDRSFSTGMWGYRLTVTDYQHLLHRGW